VNRRSSQNKYPDSIILKGSLRLQNVTTATTTGAVPLTSFLATPSQLGDRPATVNGIFTRFRIKSIKFRYSANQPVTHTGQLIMGIADDVDQSTGPSTAAHLLALRKNTRQFHIYQNKSLSWMPIDREKWYYTQGDTGNDFRFQVPCTLFYMTDIASDLTAGATTLGVLDCDYVLEFAGATDIAV
jgi:hypothetical protein